MTFADWAIVVVLILAVSNGLAHGFIRSLCSLGGLLLGLVLASWNYAHVATLIMPFARIDAVANTVAFILIAIVVMALADLSGKVLSSSVRSIGLGFLDRLAGGAFGLFQGAAVVILAIVVTLAFFPQARWIGDGKLPHMFLGACHLEARVSPSELADRIRNGLHLLEERSPAWMHPHGEA
jgi:membrane protein required for colicin V production